MVSLKTIARFCSMLLLLALILTPAGSVRAAPGNTVRVSVASDGTQSNHDSSNPSTSADGRYVAFESEADNLVSGDTNGTYDIFVREMNKVVVFFAYDRSLVVLPVQNS